MHKITGEERLCPWKSTIVGAVKIIPLEYMNIKCRSVDILMPEPGSSSETKLIENLLTECMVSPLNDIVVAYRGIHRWEPNMKHRRLESHINARDRLKNRGVYLITGGFGGMGFTIAEHLSRTYKARLILVGRSAFPDRENWDEWLKLHDPQDKISVRIKKIREFEEMGAEIMAFSADISDYNRMQEVIATAKKHFGPINGILQTAGLGDYEGVIQRRTREMTEKIMAPKVKGTLVLNTILKDENLDFIVLFSSIGNLLYKGKFGQVGYNAANEFLEFFADYKAADSHTFITTINWTDWLEVGMSIEAADILYKGK
jgi:NAD(P)-dependent dehydrogenase (short-subunit alcohol dehydrogenase family)